MYEGIYDLCNRAIIAIVRLTAIGKLFVTNRK